VATSQKWRYFCFVVYPESAPENWRQILKESHLPFAISPLHSPDDENSKPHYHVVYKHGNPITLDCAKECIPESIPANGYIEPVRNPRGYQRYLIHLDDLEKEQFQGSVKELIDVINGFPLDLTRDFSQAERAEQRRKIHGVIREFNMFEYSELLDFLIEYDNDLYDYACNHTILFNTYLTSRRNANPKGINED